MAPQPGIQYLVGTDRAQSTLMGLVGNTKRGSQSLSFPLEIQLLATGLQILTGTWIQKSLSAGFIFSPRVHKHSKCNSFEYNRHVLRIQLLLICCDPSHHKKEMLHWKMKLKEPYGFLWCLGGGL